MDKATLGGLVLAVGGIMLGLMLEGGNLSQVLQPTAALIVFGGTLGAVLIQYPLPVALSAFRRLAQVFVEPAQNAQSTIELLVKYANQARREGIISLDKELATIDEPFLHRALMLAVDGTEPQELRKIMELELDNKEEQEEKIPQLFESAGGFSPTIGIIGAVLGLIQVMQHLDKIDEVGKGIAVAFVATLYGVGTANLILLPCAGKLKIRIRNEQIIREMTLEGVVSILEGMNPRMLEAKLLGFLTEAHGPAAVPEESKRMSRRKRRPGHANHDRWLVSYADFITLLFAFFVVLYASSQVDKRKVGKLALAIQVAFQEMGVFQASTTEVPIDLSDPMPFSTAQAIENSQRTASLGRIASPPDGSLGHRRRERRSGSVAGRTGNHAGRGNHAQGNRHAPRARRSGHQFARGGFF